MKSPREEACALYRLGYSERQVARALNKSRHWVREQIADLQKMPKWRLDPDKPPAEAILDKLQAGQVAEHDPDTLEAVELLLSIADDLDESHAEIERIEHSVGQAAFHLATGGMPTSDALIGIHLRRVMRLLRLAARADEENWPAWLAAGSAR